MSKLLKILIISLAVLAPGFALGKTVSFGDKTWDVTPRFSAATQTSFAEMPNVNSIARHILLNEPVATDVSVLDDATLSQVAQITQNINQPTQNAQLTIQDNWATTFVPDQNGQAVDVQKLIRELISQNSVDLPVVTSQPQIKLSDLNTLGINELVASGVSDYTGSSANRITNVKVGSSKYDGLILQPGEEFSFNKYLGDIDAAHGFKPEQVIKASGIELEFGGGLCQVSTTMFRAAMKAGFPITQRRNHSFAVHYYYPQGTDATIYPGASDLKFINNYSTPVLIHTYITSPYVHFDVYGTKDNRQVTFEGPVVYDRKPDGSMKATWTRHVTINGTTSTYVAQSNYVSPNLYKKVEQATTPNPQATATPANTAPSPAQPTT